MLREIQAHPKETPVTVLMTQRHVPVSVVNNSHVAPAHAKAAVALGHLHSHVESSNSTVMHDINSSVSPTITRGNGAGDMRDETSAKRLSPEAHHGPPARSTGLTPDRQVDRLPHFEVCEN